MCVPPCARLHACVAESVRVPFCFPILQIMRGTRPASPEIRVMLVNLSQKSAVAPLGGQMCGKSSNIIYVPTGCEN